MNPSNVTHDPFVARDDSPVGVARRALFALHLGLEAARADTPRSVAIAAGESLLGQLVVSQRGVDLPSAPSRAEAIRALAASLLEWAQRGGACSEVVPTDDAPSPDVVGCSELFAHACALVEPSLAEDRATSAYAATSSSASCAILLRLRARDDLLPYPVHARGLGQLELRPMLELCHDAACVALRQPAALPQERTWSTLSRGSQGFGVLLGETHIAVIAMSASELQERTRTPENVDGRASGAPKGAAGAG